MGSLRPALPPKIDFKLFGLARSTWANVRIPHADAIKALGHIKVVSIAPPKGHVFGAPVIIFIQPQFLR